MPPVNSWSNHFEDSLRDLERNHLRRHRVSTKYASGAMVERDGMPLVNFGGNDYLGIRNHHQVVDVAVASLQSSGVGSGASPAVTGYSYEQMRLEQSLASFTDMQDALVFSSGFSGNLATITSLANEDCIIFSDSLNHASLIDGCRLSKAVREIYPHCDIEALKQSLSTKRHQYRCALIVTESIFSMDGDAAPLREIAELAERFDCGLIVDEAHATGVYGARGSGLIEELNLSERVLAKLGTLSKSIGCVGGYVSGKSNLTEFVLNRGRSYMFSTALPVCILTAANTAIGLIANMNSQRQQLRKRSLELRQQLRELGFAIVGVDSPIVPLILGDERAAMNLSDYLRLHGMYAPAIRPPTVPFGTSRLRISLSCEHTDAQVEQLVSAVACWQVL